MTLPESRAPYGVRGITGSFTQPFTQENQMAKAAFNMAAAIREVLADNPKATQSECMAAVQAKHPKETINVNSFGVALSAQRKKLGIVAGKAKSVKRAKPRPTNTPVPVSPQQSTTVATGTLYSAKRLVSEAGGFGQARDILTTLESLLQ